MDLLIKNGTLVSSTKIYKADVGIENGKIVAIGVNLVDDKAEIVDASGKLVLPGAIDVHTHFAMPFGGTISADDCKSGTKAAACGGVTTIFDYQPQFDTKSLLDTINEKKKIHEIESCVDYAYHCIISDFKDGKVLDEMEEVAKEGVTSFKCFSTYDDLKVNDKVFTAVIKKAKEIGGLVNLHAEDDGVISNNIKKFKEEGKLTPWYHYLSRPEAVESKAVKHAIELTKKINGSLYLVHIAAKEGLEACIDAREEGYNIYVETCPQYLEFTNEVYKQNDARSYVCSPPMKGKESREALWNAIKEDKIDTVATDHCPFQTSEKDWGIDDFTKIPNGCAGVENRYPYMLSAANEGKLTFSQVVSLCATRPAEIFGCREKGDMAIGLDADIVIYDRDKELTVTVENMHSKYDHTIWQGYKYKGYPIKTYVRGQIVYDNGDFVGKIGNGKFVKRKADLIK